MDFLKKNWGKIILAAGAFVGAILMIILAATAPEFNFVGASQTIGLLIFFVGVCAYFVTKMFDVKKLHKACVLLVTGILVTTFLGIGLAGFSANKDKAKGSMGAAYANYKQVAVDCQDKLDKFSDIRTLNTGINGVSAQMETATAGSTLVTSIKTALVNQAGIDAQVPSALEAYALFQGLKSLGCFDSTTIAEAKVVANTTYSTLTVNEDQLKLGVKKGKYVANTLLFVYVAMILSFGLAPVVMGSKKLVCCEKEAVKTK